MSCKKFKILLSAYVDGEIKNEEEKTALLKHLDTCVECRAALNSLNVTKKLFALCSPAVPDNFFETRLSARIDEYNKMPFLKKHPLFLRELIAASAAIVILVFAVTGVFKKNVYPTSDILRDSAAETAFEKDLVEIYYGHANAVNGNGTVPR